MTTLAMLPCDTFSQLSLEYFVMATIAKLQQLAKLSLPATMLMEWKAPLQL